MGKTGVSVGFAKCFILFMAVIILVQGAVYLGLSVWGLTLRDCNDHVADISHEPLEFAMDTIYFANQKCGQPSVAVGSATEMLTIDWNTSFQITHREFIFMITYAAVSGFWVIASALIIGTLCCTTTKVISAVFYWPWYLLIIAGSILDIVATVYHAIDITHTTTVDDTFSYVGITMPSSETVVSILRTFDAYFVTPAVIMTCLSCRIILIWLLNIFGGAFCLSLSRTLAYQSVEKKQTLSTQRGVAPAVITEQVVPGEQAPTAPYVQEQIIVEQFPEQIRPKPLPIVIPAVTAPMEQQDSRAYQPTDRTVMQSPVSVLPPVIATTPPQPTNDTTYRTTDAHPDRLNYPVQPSSPEQLNGSPELRPGTAPQFAVTSPLNNRYSEAAPLGNANQPNNRASEALRSQLPWSYTSMLAKPPPPPRKPQVQIYPQIPEPDYGDH